MRWGATTAADSLPCATAARARCAPTNSAARSPKPTAPRSSGTWSGPSTGIPRPPPRISRATLEVPTPQLKPNQGRFMKRLLMHLAFGLLVLLPRAHAALVLDEPFTYPDGPLTA